MGRKRTLLGIGTLHFFSNLLITSNQLDLNHITYLGAREPGIGGLYSGSLFARVKTC